MSDEEHAEVVVRAVGALNAAMDEARRAGLRVDVRLHAHYLVGQREFERIAVEVLRPLPGEHPLARAARERYDRGDFTNFTAP